jgi:hypothetical protein
MAGMTDVQEPEPEQNEAADAELERREQAERETREQTTHDETTVISKPEQTTEREGGS